MTFQILKELAIHIRNARVTFASHPTSHLIKLEHINHKWIQRFINRHPEVKGAIVQNLEWSRKEGASYEQVKRWFDAVLAMYEDHKYEPSNIWNMDESGFGIGDEQATRVLIYLDKPTKHKVIGGKQEWVTDIECISAAGEALPPLLIFKGDNVNARWIDEQTPQDWHIATSKNGWTSNNLGIQWLKRIFEPLTREIAAGSRRLLIADGHGSHIQADFIAYCM
jgi:hypothetical protein